MLKEKLLTSDLMMLKEKANIVVRDHRDIGNVNLEGEHFLLELLTPTELFDSKYVAKLDLKSYPKFVITIDEEELVNVISNVIQSSKYSSNYVLVKNEYMVFVRPGVVLYLTEEETAELVSIFYTLKNFIPDSLKEGSYGSY
jgi:hypothetical protein